MNVELFPAQVIADMVNPLTDPVRVATFDFQVLAGGGFFTVENGTFATRAQAEDFGRTNTAGLRTCRIVPTEH